MGKSELIPYNFLGLPAEVSGYETSRIVVLPIGFEATTSYGTGTRTGPDAILAASRKVEPYDADVDVDLSEAPIHTYAAVASDLSGPAAMTERIRGVAARLVADGKWILGLGGEHSVSFGLVQAAAEKHGRLSILQLDAHADLWETWDGTPHGHACVMRRIVEDGHRTVHVGIRSVSREEVDFAKAHRLPIFWAQQCAESDAWIDEAVAALEGPVYLSLDVDGLDPSGRRTTGTPEPGGLGWWPLMRLLDRLFAKHRVVGADVVELVSGGDLASDFAAARLTARVAALALKSGAATAPTPTRRSRRKS